MTWQGLEELISTWQLRWLRASRKEKRLILDEPAALCGYPLEGRHLGG